MKNKNLKPLAVIFFVSGLWDSTAAIIYFFFIGTNRIISNPPIDPFFSIFLGTFFVCFAYLQFLSAFNIKRYSFNVGCLIIGRLLYVIQLYVFMIFVRNFPTTFWFTGILDGLFVFLYLLFAVRGGLSISDLLLPKINREV